MIGALPATFVNAPEKESYLPRFIHIEIMSIMPILLQLGIKVIMLHKLAHLYLFPDYPYEQDLQPSTTPVLHSDADPLEETSPPTATTIETDPHSPLSEDNEV